MELHPFALDANLAQREMSEKSVFTKQPTRLTMGILHVDYPRGVELGGPVSVLTGLSDLKDNATEL